MVNKSKSINHPDPVMEAAAIAFERDGFCLAPPLVPAELIQRVIPRIDAVMFGEYETGVGPLWDTGLDGSSQNASRIRKIDQAHLCDRTIFEFVTHSAIGHWAAAILGAQTVQLWALQMLYKPPGGSAAGNIGWHQDWQYWKTWWEDGSEVFTAWVAVSDVSAETGPMRFVRGSHSWGLRDQGDFFSTDHDLQRQQIGLPDGAKWEEVPAILPPGGVSFHHRYTYHASGPNISLWPRRSFALHLRTEKSKPLPGATDYYVSHLNNQEICPILC